MQLKTSTEMTNQEKERFVKLFESNPEDFVAYVHPTDMNQYLYHKNSGRSMTKDEFNEVRRELE